MSPGPVDCALTAIMISGNILAGQKLLPSVRVTFFCFQSVTFFKLKMRFNLVPCRNKKFLFRQLVTRVLIVTLQNYLRKGSNVKNANSIIIALAILNVQDK